MNLSAAPPQDLFIGYREIDPRNVICDNLEQLIREILSMFLRLAFRFS